jgi:hypothetical protein
MVRGGRGLGAGVRVDRQAERTLGTLPEARVPMRVRVERSRDTVRHGLRTGCAAITPAAPAPPPAARPRRRAWRDRRGPSRPLRAWPFRRKEGLDSRPSSDLASFCETASAFSRRAFSAAMSITPSSGMTDVGIARADLHGRACRGASKPDRFRRARRSIAAALRSIMPRVASLGSGK